MAQFYSVWGIKQHVSSAYHPTGNKRAAVGVRSAKRLIRDNIGPSGSLKTNKFVQSLLNHRNTPEPLSKVSPAQIVFSREIRDIIPRHAYTADAQWTKLAPSREEAFLKRQYAKSEVPRPQKKLRDLAVGDTVYVQDQNGPAPRRWNKSGTVVECLPFNSYLVMFDGSQRLTKRNRQFLRHFISFSQPLSTKIQEEESATPQTPKEASEDAPLSAAVALMKFEAQEATSLPLKHQMNFPGGIQNTPSTVTLDISCGAQK